MASQLPKIRERETTIASLLVEWLWRMYFRAAD